MPRVVSQIFARGPEDEFEDGLHLAGTAESGEQVTFGRLEAFQPKRLTLTGKSVAMVVDGVSSPYSKQYRQRRYRNNENELVSGGAVVRSIVENYIADHWSSNRSLPDILLAANELVRQWHAQNGITVSDDYGAMSHGAAVALVRVSDTQIEWAGIADSLVIIANHEEKLVKVTRNSIQHIEGMLARNFAEGMAQYSDDKGKAWDHHVPFIRNFRNTYANRTGGYGVLNGDPRLAENDFIDFGTVSLSTAGTVLIVTDGVVPPALHGHAVGQYLTNRFSALNDSLVAMVNEAATREYGGTVADHVLSGQTEKTAISLQFI